MVSELKICPGPRAPLGLNLGSSTKVGRETNRENGNGSPASNMPYGPDLDQKGDIRYDLWLIAGFKNDIDSDPVRISSTCIVTEGDLSLSHSSFF